YFSSVVRQVVVSFLPQSCDILSGLSGKTVTSAVTTPWRRHFIATNPHRWLIRQSSSACQNRANSMWLVGRSGVVNVFGFRPLRFLAEESRRRRPCRAAGKRGLDRPDQADAGGGQGSGTARKDRGADPGGHAGDRDLQPPLYRERRALHDGDADVPIRH